jgi:mRNA interferase MazF
VAVAQGDVYWADLADPVGSAPGYRRPCVVVQSDWLNDSAIRTVVVCVLTANLTRSRAPGNVTLNAGEANLSRDCVVNVTQLLTLDQAQLGEWIGSLSRARVRQIVDGVRLVVEPVD